MCLIGRWAMFESQSLQGANCETGLYVWLVFSFLDNQYESSLKKQKDALIRRMIWSLG